MTTRSVTAGIGISALLLVVLGFARVFNAEAEAPDTLVREVETIELNPPEPPPAEPEQETPPPPPQIAFTDLSEAPDPARIPLPEVSIPINFRMAVDTFHTDIAPAALPTPVKKVSRPAAKPQRQTARRTVKRPPAVKSHYRPSELDGRPKLIRRGRASFPRALARKGVKRGTVVLEVELSTRGSVSVRRVISSTHPELIASARRAASGSRYSTPKKNGVPVKVILRLPVVLQK